MTRTRKMRTDCSDILKLGDITVLDEPLLEFANGFSTIDPRDGLSLFGPFTTGDSSHPSSPPYILLGTDHGISLFDQWAEALNISHSENDSRKHRLWPPFPGFEIAFGSRWQREPLYKFSIDHASLVEASLKSDPHERSASVVEQFLPGLRRAEKLDTFPSVAICVVPDEIYRNCRTTIEVAQPSDNKVSKRERKHRASGQTDLFRKFDPGVYLFAPDFRRQLKARAMEYSIPIQIIRESTLRLSEEVDSGGRALTSLSDRMWNLGTTLYYKCGGKPWKLKSAREGVCYIGLAFRQAMDKAQSACCAAQMFIDTGDGIVFLSEDKPFLSPKDKYLHLSRDSARKLLAGVLQTYNDLGGRPLEEIFLHSRSEINEEEWQGYVEGCPSGCKIVGIRVRTDSSAPRLYRIGEMPVMRGTFWKLTERTGYLYGSGFKPRLATYDGPETPIPLRIDIQKGNAPIELVAQDIFGLTKLNYNACRLGESKPVTIKFSNAVGEILISNPGTTAIKPTFKYYI